MNVYKSDYLEIDLQHNQSIQRWTGKQMSIDQFQTEVRNFSEMNRKLKVKRMLWLKENLNFTIPDELFNWLEDITKQQFNLGAEDLLFTIPKESGSFNSLLTFFNGIDYTYHPRYFTNKESAFDFLEKKESIKTSLITNVDVNINDNEVEFNFKIKPEKVQFFTNHINKLKNIEHYHDEYLEKYNSMTNRERQVFKLVLKGLTTSQIAEQLFVSVETIKTHRKVIIKKLKISNLNDWLTYSYVFGN